MPESPSSTEEAETEGLYLKAARAYCHSRFDYNDAVYVDGERGRRKHLEDDARAIVDNNPWLRDVVDAVAGDVSRLRTRVAELEAKELRVADGYNRLVAKLATTRIRANRAESRLDLDAWDRLQTRAEAAEAAVARVRALHSPRGVNALCPKCQDPTPAPCPTLRALDGVPAFPAVGQDGKLGNLPTVDSDTLALAEMTCPECGATIRARMAYPDGTDREKAAPNA